MVEIVSAEGSKKSSGSVQKRVVKTAKKVSGKSKIECETERTLLLLNGCGRRSAERWKRGVGQIVAAD